MKLNELKEKHDIVAYGFQALRDYAAMSNRKGTTAVVSTLSPALMADMGINTFYAPVMTRGAVYNTPDEIEAADLSLNRVTVSAAEDKAENVLIVSKHQGTIEILKSMYPGAEVMTGNITQDDIKERFVVGALPPHLIQHCKAFKGAVIKDFDYSKDNDLTGQELQERLRITEAIRVEVESV